MNPLALLDGFKTAIAGFGAIGFGAYRIYDGHADEGVNLALAGLAVLGIGRKLEKAATFPAPDIVKEAAQDATKAAMKAADSGR